MPLDNANWSYDSDAAWRDHCIGWENKISLWPRKCYYSNKILWLQRSYRGTAMWTGPGAPIFEYRWCDTKEFLFLRIKGII